MLGSITGWLGLITLGLAWLLRETIKTNWREREQLQEYRLQIYINLLDPYVRILSGVKDKRQMGRAIKQATSHEHRSNPLCQQGRDTKGENA